MNGGSTVPFLLDLRPCIFQCDCPIKDEFTGFRVKVEGEVAEALELVARFRQGFPKRRLKLAGDDFQAVRVDVGFEIAVGVSETQTKSASSTG